MARDTSIDFDTGDLARLTVDLGKVPGKAMAAVEATSAKSALNIKNGMVADATGHEMFPQFPQSISYDRKFTVTGVEYEIGPDKDRPQGPLGNILYFGTSKNAPVLNLLGPLEAEEPAYLAQLAAAAAGTLDL